MEEVLKRLDRMQHQMDEGFRIAHQETRALLTRIDEYRRESDIKFESQRIEFSQRFETLRKESDGRCETLRKESDEKFAALLTQIRALHLLMIRTLAGLSVALIGVLGVALLR